MKKMFGILMLVVLVGAGCFVYVPTDESRQRPPQDRPYDDSGSAYGRLDDAYFYDQLQPYGIWVSYSPYGYVWIPRDVGYKWRPYTRGHWVWTDYGWTWASLERWGWIAYHYGRWGWTPRLGWFWVPDIVWGPAWVAWRWGDMHIGWAPLPPGVEFVPGRGFGRHDWNIPGHHWNFVRGRDFLDTSLDRWVLPAERNTTIINNTVINVNINVRNNRVVNDGVDVDYVRRMTNRTVEQHALKDSSRPGEARISGRDLVVYKPEIARNAAAKPKQVIAQDRAADEVDAERTRRLTRPTSGDQAAVLRRAHEQENKLMQESQQTEINEVRRRAEEEKAKVQSPEEKKKVDARIQSRLGDLKKKHEQEKAELEKRQKEEEAKTKPGTVRKKIEKS